MKGGIMEHLFERTITYQILKQNGTNSLINEISRCLKNVVTFDHNDIIRLEKEMNNPWNDIAYSINHAEDMQEVIRLAREEISQYRMRNVLAIISGKVSLRDVEELACLMKELGVEALIGAVWDCEMRGFVISIVDYKKN